MSARTLALSAGSLLTATLVAACSGDVTPEPTGGETPTAAATASPTAVQTAAPTDPAEGTATESIGSCVEL